MDLISEIATEIPVESLSEDLQGVAEIFGIEGALRLTQRFGGMTIYIPKIDKLRRYRRDIRIRNEFTGINHRELARKYHMTETAIRKIVRAGPG